MKRTIDKQKGQGNRMKKRRKLSSDDKKKEQKQQQKKREKNTQYNIKLEMYIRADRRIKCEVDFCNQNR